MAIRTVWFLFGVSFSLLGCTGVERALSCRALARALEEPLGHPTILTSRADVEQFQGQLTRLEQQIEPWLTEPVWQGSDLPALRAELGVLQRYLKELPAGELRADTARTRRFSDSARRLQQSAERLVTFCAAP